MKENLRKELERYEAQFGEYIEAIAVGPRNEDVKPEKDENVLLSREAGLLKLDQDFENEYGSAACPPLYAWTKSRIFFITEYDGKTTLTWVPRHPIDVVVEFW